jgi:hypothetical protein
LRELKRVLDATQLERSGLEMNGQEMEAFKVCHAMILEINHQRVSFAQINGER